MTLIRCTQKLQKEMAINKRDLSESQPEHLLESWHANLLHIARVKCVLFVNDKTFFNFIVAGLSKAEIKKLDKIFIQHLSFVLSLEGFSEADKEKLIDNHSEIKYAKTNNRRVLGTMNDLAYHYKYFILSQGGLAHAHLPSIIQNLNRMPMGVLGYDYAIDSLRNILLTQRQL